MSKLMILTGALFSLAASYAAADNLPFVGSWGGGPTNCSDPFKFTPDSYKAPGVKPLKVRSMKQNGDKFSFIFSDDYAITVQVRKNVMTWLSEASGDIFELKRCR